MMPTLTPAQERELRVVAANAGNVRQGRFSGTWMLFKNGSPVRALSNGVVARLLVAGVVRGLHPPGQETRCTLMLSNAGLAWLDAHPEPTA